MKGRGQWLTSYNKVRGIYLVLDVIKRQIEECDKRPGDC
jgi:hypothetical protein